METHHVHLHAYCSSFSDHIEFSIFVDASLQKFPLLAGQTWVLNERPTASNIHYRIGADM